MLIWEVVLEDKQPLKLLVFNLDSVIYEDFVKPKNSWMLALNILIDVMKFVFLYIVVV